MRPTTTLTPPSTALAPGLCKMLDLLPCETLQLITNRLDGYAIAFTWLCGNKRLNQRLGNGRGVICFRHVVDPLYRLAWPSLVRNFLHLESFLVEPRFPSMMSGQWRPNFSDLSPTLQNLKLLFSGDAISFLTHCASLPDAFPHLNSIESDFGYTEEPIEPFKALPSLESFRVEDLNLSAIRPSRLPLHLKDLHLTVYVINLSEGVFFPDTLETLRLKIINAPSSWPWNFFRGLPVGLKELCIMNVMEKEIILFGNDDEDPEPTPNAEDIASLPRSLLVLCIVPWSQIELETVQALPPALTELRIHGLDGESPRSDAWCTDSFAALKSLPKTLTSCDCGLPGYTAENIDFYPPKLICRSPWTSFDETDGQSKNSGTIAFVAGPPQLEEEKSQKLPESVTELKSCCSDYLDLHPLPSSLTHLKLIMDPNWNPIKRADHVPKNLSELVMSSYEPRLFPLECMPTHLKVLKITGPTFKMTPGECEALPRSLDTLRLQKLDLESPNLSFSLLPHGITDLDVSVLELEVGFLKAVRSRRLLNLTLELFKDDTSQLALDIMTSLPNTLVDFKLRLHCSGFSRVTTETAPTVLSMKSLSITIPWEQDGSHQQSIGACYGWNCTSASFSVEGCPT